MRLSINTTQVFFVVVVSLALMLSTGATDNAVVSEGDVDSSPNISTASGFVNAQVKDGVSETISETQNLPLHPINATSDIDGNGDKGTHSSFANLASNDDVYDLLMEGDHNPGNTHSLDTSGNSGYMTIGDGSVSWSRTTGTISFWMRFKNFANTYRPWGQSNNFEIRNSGSKIVLDWGAGSTLTSTTSLSVDTWYFIGVTWNENSNTLKLYIGTEASAPSVDVSSTSWTGTTSETIELNAFLDGRGVSQIVNGYGDDLRFYGIDRTLSDIQSDYKVKLKGDEPYLISYYTLDNNYNDFGPAGNNGQAVSSPVFTTVKKPAFPTANQKMLHLEMQFTNIDYTTNYVNLGINTGTFGSEGLALDYWGGTYWITLLPNLSAGVWNSVSIDGLLTSATFTIRFRDIGSTTDGTVNTWNIDNVRLSYTNYKLDHEQTVSSLSTTDEYYQLTIYGGSSDSEQFDVSIWNSSASTWLTPSSTISTTAWYNSTIDRTLVTSSMTWRYTSKSDVKDTTKTTLSIDYAGIYSYNILPIFSSAQVDTGYEFGNIGNTVSWTGGDENPGTYTLYRNGTSISSGSWSNASAITVNVDGLNPGVYNLTMEIKDAYNNKITDLAWLTVTDSVAPTINNPTDVSYAEGTTGNIIAWQGNDNFPDNYKVFKNGSSYTTGSWSSNINVDIDGLTFGYYNFSIIIYDTSGQFATDIVWVNVTDGTSPSIASPPPDRQISEGSTGNNITWSVSDTHPDLYNIYKNGTLISNSSWTTGVVLNIDGNIKGTYNYTAIFYDVANNQVKDVVIIYVVDTTPPTVSSPSDVNYEEGTTGHQISWTATELYPTTFAIYKDGNLLFSAPYQSGSPVTIGVDGLSYGSYNYTIVFSDASSNSAADTVFVNVSDTVVPSINNPSNVNMDEGTLGNDLIWIATEANEQTYWIYKNGSQVATGSYISGAQIIYDLDSLTIGVYNFTILVSDQSGNQATDLVWVTVSDVTPPSISSPSDIQYNEGSSGNTITWAVSDAHPANYTLFIDDVPNNQSTWSNGNIVQNVDGISLGSHNYTLFIQDGSGNNIADTVIVTVTDATNPVIDHPSDIAYNEGATSNIIVWTATDLHAGTYTITRNGTQVDSGSWTSGIAINLNVDGLLLGTYSYVITIYDTSSNSITDEVLVVVSDTNNPSLNSPSDTNYNEGTSGNTIDWVASDTHADQMKIYRNETLILSSSWTSGTISINTDGLSVGVYNFTIYLTDTSGNSATDTIWLTVIDNITPSITNPSDIIYPLDSTGHSLEWIPSDLHADNYTIYRNGSVIHSGNWISGAPINISIDGLVVGNHNYTIIIEDTSGNLQTDLVWVKVTSEAVFDSTPSDLYYLFGNTSNTLSWTATDFNPDKYEIFKNGTSVASGTWTSGTPITINVDGLPYGVFNYSIYINDTDGNFITDYALVIVSDRPIWDIQQSNSTIIEGTISNTISWNATDQFPDYFIIYRNGTEVDIGNWDNASVITLNIDGLSIGVYNFTVLVNDTVNNQITSTAWITVIDTTNPGIIKHPDISYSEGTTGHSIQWNASDLHPDTYVIYRNGTVVDTGTWSTASNISISVDGLTKGVYNFTLLVNDTSGNSITSVIYVTVLDTTDPVIDSPSDFAYSEGSTGNTITWSPTDNYADTYSIERNGTEVDSGNWISGNGISISVDGLTKSVYNFTIIVVDVSGNQVIDTVFVTVLDTTNPAVHNPPGDRVINEGSNGNIISWNATDNYASSYEIFKNGTSEVIGNWTSAQFVDYNVDSYALGIYNITILFTDESGNTMTDTLWLTVNDVTLPLLNNPGNMTYSEGTSPHQIIWVVTELNPANYTVYQNGTFYTSGSYSNGGNIQVDVAGLSKSVYNYTIVAQDSSGNRALHTVWVTVNDTTNPTIDSPADVNMNEGDVGSQIQWTGSDVHPQNYTIFRNGTIVTSGTWINTITVNLDGTLKGTWNFTVYLQDNSGNTNTDMVMVNVSDATAPTTDTPADTSYQETTTGHSITWNVADNYKDRYLIYLEGILDVNATWSGSSINYVIDGHTIGTYNVTLVLIDQSGNTADDTIFFTVTDPVNPVLTTYGNITYEEGSSGHLLNFTGDDLNNDTYFIYNNGSQVDNGNWISGQNVSYNIDGLTIGIYNFTIVIYDVSGNSVMGEVWIFVIDTLSPELNHPSDIIYSEGTIGNAITWNATEQNPDIYKVYRNGTQIASTFYTSGVDIVIPVDGLSKNTYNFTIVVYDSSGNNASDMVLVIVQDTTSPTLSSPSDVNYVESTINNKIIWSASDNYPANYTVYKNGSNVSTGNWTNGGIEINIDGNLIGVYNYTIIISDQSGNLASDEVLVFVNDPNPPQINHPADTSYVEGTTGNTITWFPSDNYPGTYIIYLDGDYLTGGSWSNNTPIIINIDNNKIGTYNYTIELKDGSNNITPDTVMVLVYEVTAPTIIAAPQDFSIAEGTTGYVLLWDVYDKYPGTYTIDKNGQQVQISVWSNTANITYSIDGLLKGTYTFILHVFDSSGNEQTDVVIITILDQTDPLISGSSDFTFESGTLNHQVHWNGSDAYPGTFDIYLDGIRVVSNSVWTSDPIFYGVDSISLGEHNITIVLRDASGNSIKDTIFVTSQDTINPTMISGPLNINLAEGSSSNLLWNFSDVNPGTYIINQNGSVVSSGNVWTSGNLFSYPLVGLTKAVYNYSLIVSDVSGNIFTTYVLVEVIDATDPVFLEQQSDFNYTEGTTSHTISWTMLDTYASLFELYRNGELIESGTWVSNVPESFVIDNLAAGSYNFTFGVGDDSNNTISHSVIVFVLDETAPAFTSVTNAFEFDEEETGNNVAWEIYDLHPWYFNLTLDGQSIRNGTWNVNDTITLNVDDLEAGEYTLDLFIIDLSGNNASASMNFIVVDTTVPVIIEAPSPFTYLLGTEGNILQYQVFDKHPGSYILYQDGIVIHGNLWTNEDLVSLPIDGLPAAYYNFTIDFVDASQNHVIHSVIVRVKDPRITDTNRPEIEYHSRVYAGDIEIIEGNWTDIDGKLIDNGTVIISLYLQNLLFTYNVSTVNGSYIITFDYADLAVGEYYWNIVFVKPGYQTWDDIFLGVEIIPFDYVVSIDVAQELIQGEEFFIYATVQYTNTSLNNNSLSLSEYIPNSGAAVGVEVKFVVVLVDIDGTVTSVTKLVKTSDNGIALISLSPQQTLNLDRIESIRAEVASTDNNQPSSIVFEVSSLPEVQPSKPTTWDILLATVLRYIVQIISVISVLIIGFILLLLQERKRQKRVRLINENIKVAYDEARAIESIQSIIIQTTSKLTLYEEIFVKDTLNTNLVGGMVTAFSSFLNEVGQSELFGFEMMERDDVNLIVHKGRHSNFIVISKRKLPMIMLFQIQMVQAEIERQFKSNLTNTARGVIRLTKEQVHPIYHKMKFKIPLTQRLTLNEKNINSIMKERSISRVLKHHIEMLTNIPINEDGSFYLKDIKNYFRSRGVEEKVSLRTAIIAYEFDIIDAHTIPEE